MTVTLLSVAPPMLPVLKAMEQTGLEVDVREVILAVLVSLAMIRMLREGTDVGSKLELGVGTEVAVIV